jgi:hypothetical protein
LTLIQAEVYMNRRLIFLSSSSWISSKTTAMTASASRIPVMEKREDGFVLTYAMTAVSGFRSVLGLNLYVLLIKYSDTSLRIAQQSLQQHFVSYYASLYSSCPFSSDAVRTEPLEWLWIGYHSGYYCGLWVGKS